MTGDRTPGRMLSYGDGGVLIEVPDLEAVLALAAAINARRLPGVVDVVPAATTVLVRLDPGRTDAAWRSSASSSVANAGSCANTSSRPRIVASEGS